MNWNRFFAYFSSTEWNVSIIVLMFVCTYVVLIDDHHDSPGSTVFFIVWNATVITIAVHRLSLLRKK
jgi:hypothetical protein